MCFGVSVFVIFVTTLIVVPYIIVAIFLIFPVFEHSPVLLVCNEVFAAVGVVALLRVYFKASFTSPGYVPDGYQPDRSDIAVCGQPKFCNKCSAWKPPRSHHCKECKRCVLKMDHHCPWIANCVGHRNHKLFLLFLAYAVTMITYLVVVCFLRFRMLLQRVRPPRIAISDLQELIWLSVLTIVYVSLVLSIGSLLVYQLWLLSHNKTTIDYYEHAKEARRARQAGEKSKVYYPYDLGSTLDNMRETLGARWQSWFVITEPVGDGLRFRMSRRAMADLELGQQQHLQQSLFAQDTSLQQTLVHNI